MIDEAERHPFVQRLDAAVSGWSPAAAALRLGEDGGGDEEM
jgi:hypothetical protein